MKTVWFGEKWATIFYVTEHAFLVTFHLIEFRYNEDVILYSEKRIKFLQPKSIGLVSKINLIFFFGKSESIDAFLGIIDI